MDIVVKDKCHVDKMKWQVFRIGVTLISHK